MKQEGEQAEEEMAGAASKEREPVVKKEKEDVKMEDKEDKESQARMDEMFEDEFSNEFSNIFLLGSEGQKIYGEGDEVSQGWRRPAQRVTVSSKRSRVYRFTVVDELVSSWSVVSQKFVSSWRRCTCIRTKTHDHTRTLQQ